MNSTLFHREQQSVAQDGGQIYSETDPGLRGATANTGSRRCSPSFTRRRFPEEDAVGVITQRPPTVPGDPSVEDPPPPDCTRCCFKVADGVSFSAVDVGTQTIHRSEVIRGSFEPYTPACVHPGPNVCTVEAKVDWKVESPGKQTCYTNTFFLFCCFLNLNLIL